MFSTAIYYYAYNAHIFRVLPEMTAKKPDVKPRVQKVAVNTTIVKKTTYVL